MRFWTWLLQWLLFSYFFWDRKRSKFLRLRHIYFDAACHVYTLVWVVDILKWDALFHQRLVHLNALMSTPTGTWILGRLILEQVKNINQNLSKRKQIQLQFLTETEARLRRAFRLSMASIWASGISGPSLGLELRFRSPMALGCEPDELSQQVVQQDNTQKQSRLNQGEFMKSHCWHGESLDEHLEHFRISQHNCCPIEWEQWDEHEGLKLWDRVSIL